MSEGNKGVTLNAKTIGIILLIIAVLAGGYYLVVKKDILKPASNNSANNSKASDNDKYQAVFLTNGQVYFGKLADNGGNYVKLTDIYYLQSKDQSVQPKDTATADQSNLTLIKLGKELHAPADEMNISRTQVLFWENINEDGKVFQAIKEYKASNK
ncbi:MAG: hypothetical protein AAB632_01930 [Patescibacteria group bacterium]|mgnify:CR=1 FL=1